jgi:hypothetical protein
MCIVTLLTRYMTYAVIGYKNFTGSISPNDFRMLIRVLIYSFCNFFNLTTLSCIIVLLRDVFHIGLVIGPRRNTCMMCVLDFIKLL